MSRHPIRRGPANAFLSWRLEGWHPEQPGVAFPVSLAVYREGPNLGLYLTPASVEGVVASLRLPDDHAAIVRHPVMPPRRPVARLATLGRLREGEGAWPRETELVHLAPGAAAADVLARLPDALLADPASAVPPGSRFALALHDGCHAALFTPDRGLARRCVAGFLGDLQVAVLGREAELPAIDPALLEPLLEPVDPGAWWRLRFRPHRRYWRLDLELSDELGTVRTDTWVSEGEGGRWRAGWHW